MKSTCEACTAEMSMEIEEEVYEIPRSDHTCGLERVRCIIKGHDHELVVVRTITQKGTGTQARLYECPTGRYRFFCIEGQNISRDRMYIKPPYGWPHK